MSYVDDLVLDTTEWLCQRFQALTGRTNVWVAVQLTNLSIVVYFAWTFGLFQLSSSLSVRGFFILFCGGVFFGLTRTVFKTSIDAANTEAYTRVAKGLRNPRRLRDAQLRIAFLSLSVLMAYPVWFAYTVLRVRFFVLTEVLVVLTAVVLYVLACDPLPPCRSRVSEWLASLRPVRPESQPTSSEVTFGCHGAARETPRAA